MIRYALTCANGHSFESWFKSSEGFAGLQKAGMVSCPDCGATQVEKALMAPGVQTARKAEAGAAARAGELTREVTAGAAARPLSQPQSPREAALAELRRQVEANSEYVGMSFAAEARAIHEGEAPERAIWGEARPDEAKALLDEGIAVTPLPFRGDGGKSN